MPETGPEQNERIVHDAAHIYGQLTGQPVAEADGKPWPSPELALRVAALGSLFMHGGPEGKFSADENVDAVAAVTRKILSQFPSDTGEHDA